MKFKALAVSALFILFSSVTGAATSSIPHHCPDAKSVKALASQFKVAKYEPGSNVWFAYLNNHFDSKYRWTFIVSEVHAKDGKEAHQKLAASLAGLYFTDGPFYGTDDHSVECHYRTADGLYAGAMNPPVFAD